MVLAENTRRSSCRDYCARSVSRNIYRDQPESFAYDGLALALSQEAISLQLDAQLNPEQRSFLYMPFMHSESKLIHAFALKLFQRLGNEINLSFEKNIK